MKIKSPANISLNKFICVELNISILTPNINTKSKNKWYIIIKIIDIPLTSSINPTLFPRDFFLLATFIPQSFLATFRSLIFKIALIVLEFFISLRIILAAISLILIVYIY